jgi:hypothetical protein
MIIRALFFVIGVLCIVSGGDTILNDRNLVHSGVHTTGVVVALDLESHRGNEVYTPEVRFAVPDGQTYVVRGPAGADPQAFAVGHAATVYYDPRHPQTAVVDSDHLYWDAFLMIVVGTVFALTSAWPLLRLLRRDTSRCTTRIKPRRQAPARRQRDGLARQQR